MQACRLLIPLSVIGAALSVVQHQHQFGGRVAIIIVSAFLCVRPGAPIRPQEVLVSVHPVSDPKSITPSDVFLLVVLNERLFDLFRVSKLQQTFFTTAPFHRLLVRDKVR